MDNFLWKISSSIDDSIKIQINFFCREPNEERNYLFKKLISRADHTQRYLIKKRSWTNKIADLDN